MRVWLVVALVLLAGCSGEKAEGDKGQVDGIPAGKHPILSGWVLDAALAPVVGASVSIPGENLTAVVDENGLYGFSAVPRDRPLLVIVRADGFIPASKTITLPPDERAQMNFSLERIPVKTPYREVQDFTGFMGCSMIIKVNHQGFPFDCSSASPQDARVWEFTIGADAKNIFVETFWEADTELARHFNVTVETVGYGDLDDVLGTDEAGTPVRIQVPEIKTDRFYREGGIVRVTVDIGRNVASEESGSGIGWGLQQSFQVIATTFYVTAGPPDYTAA